MGNDEFVMGTGQAHELAMAFGRNGWTNADVKWLSGGGILADVLRVRRGCAEIRECEYVIDCDADPFVPRGWTVEEHRRGGSFRWDPAQVRLYLSEPQRAGKVVKGKELHKELADKQALNANVLDYLLAHPRLIPEEWKKDSEGHIRHISFWGTVYCGPGGYLGVRYLYWCGRRWRWNCRWLVDGLGVSHPAALRVDAPTEVAA